MKLCLLGVDFTNSNYGCQALGYSVLKIVSDICEAKNKKLDVIAIVYNDYREAIYDKSKINMSYICIRPKKLSFYKSIRKAFKESDVIIDMTGGDSFSDIYGVKNFALGSIVKNIAIRSKTPFVLGPQTIGPFYRGWIKQWGKWILKNSDCVFARDEKSLKYARKVAGIKPILATDVAFMLPYDKSTENNNSNDKIKVGINPSGLLWFENKTFDSKKHVSVDYREYLMAVMKRLSEKSDYEIHLIPHVYFENTTEYDENCKDENDMQACLHIQKLFPNVIIEKDISNPMEAKTVIAKMDVFTGARMHATIGAYSSGTPVIPFSYSRKFEGLFGSLGYDYLINGTTMDTETAINKTLEWISKRDELALAITKSEPLIKEKVDAFVDAFSKYIK